MRLYRVRLQLWCRFYRKTCQGEYSGASSDFNKKPLSGQQQKAVADGTPGPITPVRAPVPELLAERGNLAAPS
jgi:hypothetical protein